MSGSAASAAGERPPRIAAPDEAERFVAALATIMGELERLLEVETDHIRAGRVREGLDVETRKSQLSADYLRGLEDAKANAVALARFAPDALDALREAHAGFRAAVERNQLVIATARAVAEGLMRGVADEMSRAVQPTTYGASRRMVEPNGAPGPIACSRKY